MSETDVNVDECLANEKTEMAAASENLDFESKEPIKNEVSAEKIAETSPMDVDDPDKNVVDDTTAVSDLVKDDFASTPAAPEPNVADSSNKDIIIRTDSDPNEKLTAKENDVNHKDVNIDRLKIDNDGCDPTNISNDSNLPGSESDNSEINKDSEACPNASDTTLTKSSDLDVVETANEEIHHNGPSTGLDGDLKNENKISTVTDLPEEKLLQEEKYDPIADEQICDVKKDELVEDFVIEKNIAFVDREQGKDISENCTETSVDNKALVNNTDCPAEKDDSILNSDCDMEKDSSAIDPDIDIKNEVIMNNPDCDTDNIALISNSDIKKDDLLNSSDVDMETDGLNDNCDVDPIMNVDSDIPLNIPECDMDDTPVEKSDEEKDILVENFDCDKVTDSFEDKHCELEKDGLDTTNQGCDEESISEDNQDCDMAENNPEEEENCDAISEVNQICHADDDENQMGDDKSDENLLEKSTDIPQASDPFDDLLDNDKNENISDTMEHQDSGIIENDIDNHMLDDDLTPVIDESESAHVADINHGQGADEEVCLLPDTEREITEADKLKALASKKTIDIDSTANAYESLTKGDDITELKDEVMVDTNDESHAEEIDGVDQAGDHGVEDDIEDESLREVPEKENEEEHVLDETIDSGIIQEIVKVEQTCFNCTEIKDCIYRMLVENEMKYLCIKSCVNVFQESHPDKYKIIHRKVTVSEINPVFATCMQCSVEKKCYYRVTSGSEVKNICQEECLQLVINENLEKYKLRKKKKMVTEIDEKKGICFICSKDLNCIYETLIEGDNKYICGDDCLEQLQSSQPNVFRVKRKKVMKSRQPMLKLKVISNATDKYLDEGNKIIAKTPAQAEAARIDRDRSFLRKCAHCNEPYIGNDKNLSWETMDFCNEICLGKYQNTHGLHCANCKNAVSMVSLGKYCVRFGYDIRQFCCSGCLDEFKKGLKICCYCQRDISADYEGFLAPVGDQGQFKDFCSQFCVEKFDQMSKNPVPPPVWAQCAVCSKEKPTQLEVAVGAKKSLRLCSEPCFAAFKFVNTVFPDQCRWCKKYFERKSAESYTIYTEASAHCFCSKTCMNVYISNSRHIVPCNWCKVKKYNFDMIKKTLENGQSMMMCSLNCLTLYQVSVNAVSSRRIKCDQCKRFSQAQYHLTMSDATVRNFCTYQCVMSFQRQYTKSPMVADGDSQAVPTGAPRRTYNNQKVIKTTMKKSPGRPSGLPVISNVQSLATPPPLSNLPQVSGHATRAKSKKLLQDKPKSPPSPPPEEPPKVVTPPPPPPPKIFNHVIFKPPPPKEARNVSTLTKPLTVTKGVSCRPHPCSKEVQTDDHLQRRILIPIPVPIYVPAPMAMYSLPLPIPIPIPLPIPIPVFIPTTRNSANGIMKEIKKIHDKMPTDPFEAELLMMAEMVAGDKKKCESDSDSEDENGDDGFSPDPMDAGNSAFGEDVLQMALKMATEYEEPAVDLESAMTASTITPSSHPTLPAGMDENSTLHHHQLMILEQQRAAAAAAAAANAVGRKRGAQGGASPVNAAGSRSKRSRRNVEPPPPTHHAPPEAPREPQEKPDANMCLKFTFGVNAWKQWVMTKNAEMEKSTVRRKPFKSEILQLTADELNYSLCLFVKEVRKPNGSEYAPDTIYYLVLGIQQYLFENSRIDNIFTDSYYEKFTECLDEVARKFSVLYNDSQYIVTRVEEEHLWESKQLGAHSPHVLLSTLMFFNTKHFNLVTVEEHMQLSFSHIMKHWKRNPNQPGAAKIPGARNVLLRFYPPQAALEANSRKKKVYEQQENEENPLRCPVKLYEFYISKCPESVKTRNDVFYLMPERSCVPDSPVWYSTQALGREPLSKMLHRVKMVKEINIALLTS